MRTLKQLGISILVLTLCVLPRLTAEEKLDLPGQNTLPPSPSPTQPQLQPLLAMSVPNASYPWETPEETALRDRLARLTGEINLDDIAFEQLIDHLRDLTSINIVVNWSALQTAAIESDKEVSIKLTSGTVSFRRALELILEEVGGGEVELNFTILGGAITISTREDLARRTQIVFYNVSDILRAAELRYRFAEPLSRLVEMIQTTVDPESWREAGGNTGAINDFSDILVVTQTYGAHETIWEILQALRIQMGLPIDGPMTPIVVK